MSLRNLWSLEPGEVKTAEAIKQNISDCEIFFPLKDKGIDLLLFKGGKFVTLQVKESRYYLDKERSENSGHSWHNLKVEKLEDVEAPDFFIFVTYLEKYGTHKISSFETKFIIIPKTDLRRLVKDKSKGKKGTYTFYFDFSENPIIEKRDKMIDVSSFYEKWHLIKEMLT